MLKEGIAQKYIFSVVLDGSNIIHGGYRCDNADGNRLLSAYNYFRSKGYVVFVIVKTGTLTYMSPEGLDGEQNGWSALEGMIRDGLITKIKQNDDMAVINLALFRNAYIVTNDTFEDKWDNGHLQERERSKNPDLDWDRIDRLTFGTESGHSRTVANDDWYFDGPTFMMPNCPEAQTPPWGVQHDKRMRHLIELERRVGEIIADDDDPSPELHESLRSLRAHSRAAIKQPLSREKLDSMILSELRELCIVLGIPKSGKKADVISRILASNPNLAETEPPNPAETEPPNPAETEPLDPDSDEFIELFANLLKEHKSKEKDEEHFSNVYSRAKEANPSIEATLKGRAKPSKFLEKIPHLVPFRVEVNGTCRTHILT